MARISVFEILTDPDLTDRVDVYRRKEQVDSHGWASTQNIMYPGKIAVVTMNGSNSLDRRDDYQVQPQSISVIMNFPLYHEVVGYQPDIIGWRGNFYLVTSIDPYPQFGPGFYESICSSTKHMDQIILPDFYHRQMVFSNPINSQYFPAIFY